MSKVAYGTRELADELGLPLNVIMDAIYDGHLVARYLGTDHPVLIANYDVEIWLLGLPDLLEGMEARIADRERKEAQAAANREARLKERRDAKAARAARAARKAADEAARAEEDAQLAADLAELERLRELVNN
jgi:hypothetical protein